MKKQTQWVRPWVIFFCFLAIFSVAMVYSFAAKDDATLVKVIDQDQEEEAGLPYHTVRTESGLRFKVVGDMPIVKRNGVEMAMPLDEYIYRELRKVSTHMRLLDMRLDQLEKEVRGVRTPAKADSLN